MHGSISQASNRFFRMLESRLQAAASGRIPVTYRLKPGLQRAISNCEETFSIGFGELFDGQGQGAPFERVFVVLRRKGEKIRK